MIMKTILEHLVELPKPFNEMALDNALNYGNNLEIPINSKSQALSCAFVWFQSDEGEKFWQIIDEVFCKD